MTNIADIYYMSRPKSDSPTKSEKIEIRVTREEKEFILKAAETDGKKISKWILDLAISYAKNKTS